MINRTLNLAKVLFGSFLAIALIGGCGGGDKSATTSPTPAADRAASPTADVKNASSTSNQLTFQQSVLVRKNPDGKGAAVKDGVFKRGEDVTFVLLNVGKFQKGKDGKNWLEMDMSVKDPQGKVVFSKQNLLGEKGKTVLPNDIAASPNGTVNTTPKIAPGVYQITLTIYDKVSGNKVSETKPFTLK